MKQNCPTDLLCGQKQTRGWMLEEWVGPSNSSPYTVSGQEAELEGSTPAVAIVFGGIDIFLA